MTVKELRIINIYVISMPAEQNMNNFLVQSPA